MIYQQMEIRKTLQEMKDELQTLYPSSISCSEEDAQVEEQQISVNTVPTLPLFSDFSPLPAEETETEKSALRCSGDEGEYDDEMESSAAIVLDPILSAQQETMERSLKILESRMCFDVRFRNDDRLIGTIVRGRVHNDKIQLLTEYPKGSGVLWNSITAFTRQCSYDYHLLNSGMGNLKKRIEKNAGDHYLYYVADDGIWRNFLILLPPQVKCGKRSIGKFVLPRHNGTPIYTPNRAEWDNSRHLSFTDCSHLVAIFPDLKDTILQNFELRKQLLSGGTHGHQLKKGYVI